ncbi:MAG: hypothetical protein JJT78_09935 [Leptospira sp.]|nr:hypothetical protein [Leptospira sp.]
MFLLSIIATLDCKKKIADEDMQDCDKIYNYYEGGSHYIRRDLVKDDGVIDYEKLLDESQIKRSDCYPAKDIELDATIGD